MSPALSTKTTTQFSDNDVGVLGGGGERPEHLGPVFPGEFQDTTLAISVSSARMEKRRNGRGGEGRTETKALNLA